jgi:hypothetical protein
MLNSCGICPTAGVLPAVLIGRLGPSNAPGFVDKRAEFSAGGFEVAKGTMLPGYPYSKHNFGRLG